MIISSWWSGFLMAQKKAAGFMFPAARYLSGHCSAACTTAFNGACVTALRWCFILRIGIYEYL